MVRAAGRLGPLATALVALALVAFCGSVALAASSIRVKVNDQPITSYDIAQRAALLRLSGAKGGEKAADKAWEGADSLEWTHLPSPPPYHSFETPPVVK